MNSILLAAVFRDAKEDLELILKKRLLIQKMCANHVKKYT